MNPIIIKGIVTALVLSGFVVTFSISYKKGYDNGVMKQTSIDNIALKEAQANYDRLMADNTALDNKLKEKLIQADTSIEVRTQTITKIIHDGINNIKVRYDKNNYNQDIYKLVYPDFFVWLLYYSSSNTQLPSYYAPLASDGLRKGVTIAEVTEAVANDYSKIYECNNEVKYLYSVITDFNLAINTLNNKTVDK